MGQDASVLLILTESSFTKRLVGGQRAKYALTFQGLSNPICPLYTFLGICPILVPFSGNLSCQQLSNKSCVAGQERTNDQKEVPATRWLGTYKFCGLAVKVEPMRLLCQEFGIRKWS